MGKQKLSPEAALAKARRDLRYANSRDREIKRADAQKKRREAKKDGKKIDGKDYDHNTGSFVDSGFNRGGTQKGGIDGTKAENRQSRRT
jgi:hypothetical protein